MSTVVTQIPTTIPRWTIEIAHKDGGLVIEPTLWNTTTTPVAIDWSRHIVPWENLPELLKAIAGAMTYQLHTGHFGEAEMEFWNAWSQ